MPMPANNSFDAFEQENGLEQFVVEVPTVESTAVGQTVKDLFDQNPDAEGVVVMERGFPAGLVMRTVFFQKLGTMYGHSLYTNRPVSILMDTDIMRVDAADHMAKVGIQAMNRKQGKVYDYIIVCRDKTYIGAISIRMFLMALSQKNEAQIRVLKNQQQKLLHAHKQETMLRKSLEYQSAAVSNLLDHADQGFLWFGKDLMIKDEYSYKCVSIFQQNIGALSYMALVAPAFGTDKREVFEMAFESYFKNNSPVTDQVYLMLLPSDCLIHGKNIHFQYRKIESDGEKAVMVILNDITEKINLEKAMADDQNKQRLLIKALSFQTQIGQMLEEFRALFSGGYRTYFRGSDCLHQDLNELFRAVHTFKGDFAQYGFVAASDQLHHLEDALLAAIQDGPTTTLEDVERIMAGADPEAMLRDDLNVICEALGHSYFGHSEMISFPKSKLTEMEEKIGQADSPLDPSTVIGLMQELKKKNLKMLLEQYRDYLQYLANRVMKKPPVFLVEGCDVAVDPEQYGSFIKSLVHIFRNSMDHGIETDEERLEKGKEERGLVECRIERLDDQWFSLTISDDGRGMDIDKIKQRAMENSLCTAQRLEEMSEGEICNLVFADHFSTKDCADALSGRGVGMSAVWEACRSLGGRVEIVTEKDKGTSFRIQLPDAG